MVTQVKAKTEDEAETKLSELFSLPEDNIISFNGIYTKKEMKRVIRSAKGCLKVYGNKKNIIFGLIRNHHPKKGEMLWKLLNNNADFYDGEKENIWGVFTSAELSAIVLSYRHITS